VNGDGVYDTFERAYYANLLGGDLFVSVHINASGTNAYAVGSDLFVCGDTPHGEASSALMASMKASLCYAFPARRVGAREDGWDDAFVVTKYADMPAILVEAGFASNNEDAKLLTDPAWQDAFAVAVAEGIEMYLLGY
jgi:N-acetylmuramoyl-L-alanine amidase